MIKESIRNFFASSFDYNLHETENNALQQIKWSAWFPAPLWIRTNWMFRGNNERYPNPTYHFSQSFIVLVMLCTRNSAKFSIHRCVSRFFSSIFIYISAILVTHIRQRTSHFIPFPRISFRIFPIPSFFSPDQRIEQIDFLDR